MSSVIRLADTVTLVNSFERFWELPTKPALDDLAELPQIVGRFVGVDDGAADEILKMAGQDTHMFGRVEDKIHLTDENHGADRTEDRVGYGEE